MAKTGTNIKNYDNSPDMGNVDYVVEWQKPTERNGYTWYRLYASGWIIISGQTQNDKTNYDLPKTMSDTNYTVIGGINGGKSSTFYSSDYRCYPVSQTQIYINALNNGNVKTYCYLVMGYIA